MQKIKEKEKWRGRGEERRGVERERDAARSNRGGGELGSERGRL